MSITAENWKNKKGTSSRNCNCGSWKQHWINSTKKTWPTNCSIKGCDNSATLGAHIINSDVVGERIVPACDSCNKLDSEFDLKGSISVPSANKSLTCEK